MILFPSVAFCGELHFDLDSKNQENIIYSSSDNRFYLYPELGKDNFYYQDIDSSDGGVNYSPNKIFALIQRAEIGTLWNENGEPEKKSKYYCDLVRVEDGCIIDYFDGDMCYGKWDDKDNIIDGAGHIVKVDVNKSRLLPPKDMSNDDYFEVDFKYSIRPYVQCYPLDKNNLEHYETIAGLLKKIKYRDGEANYLYRKIKSYNLLSPTDILKKIKDNSKNIDVKTLKDTLSVHPLSKYNVTHYNNIAYYLERKNQYEESVFLLNKIIEKYPSRIVAYINIGDALWEMKNVDKAKDAYRTYIKLMQENGKENKIPKQVLERVSR